MRTVRRPNFEAHRLSFVSAPRGHGGSLAARLIALVTALVLTLTTCADGRAPLDPDDPGDGPETIRILPRTLTLPAGDRFVFEVFFGDLPEQALVWSATAGTIAGAGPSATYTAPAQPGTYTITARSPADSKVRGTAMIRVETIGSQPGNEPSGPALIEEARAAGEIDASTATLYKAYWAFGDARLPARFAGTGEWAGHVPPDVYTPPEGVSAAVRDALKRYALPPNDPESWYQLQWRETNGLAEGTGASIGGIGAFPAPGSDSVAWQLTPDDDPVLAGRSFLYVTAPSGKWRIAWDVKFPNDRVKAETLATEMDFIWERYSRYLRRTPWSHGEEEPFDFYLVDLPGGIAGQTVPYFLRHPEDRSFDMACPSQGSHILLGRSVAAIRVTFAHELFHAFQFAMGKLGPCFLGGWLDEATATWSETFIFPDLAKANNGPLLKDMTQSHFIETLSDWDAWRRSATGTYGYAAFPFFVYLDRHDYPERVFDTLVLRLTLDAWAAVDLASGGFARQFNEFALEAWGEPPYDRLPGWLGLDKALTRHSLDGPQTTAPYELELEGEEHKEWPTISMLPAASFQYFWMKVGAKSPPKRLLFRNPFRGNLPEALADGIGLQLLYRRTGEPNWSREDLSTIDEKSFCFEKPGEDYDEFALVVSNGNLPAGTGSTLDPIFRTFVEGWDACAREIGLNPGTITIQPGEEAAFEVTIEPEYEGVPRYRFRTQGSRGAFPAGAKEVRTESPSVAYRANPNAADGAETIEVEVFDEDGESLGKATSTVEVRRRYTVSLQPAAATVAPATTASFQAVLTPAYPGGDLSYRWTSTETQGAILPASGSVTGISSATYHAFDDREGSDEIAVEVFDGEMRSLGAASATVTVECPSFSLDAAAAPGDVALSMCPTRSGGTVEFDSVIFQAGSSSRYCVVAYITFPLVEGAGSYEMHAHGFNDTYYWGTEIRQTFQPPFAEHRPCEAGSWGTSGSANGKYYFFLSGQSGPAEGAGDAMALMVSRFQGMKIDVTVRF